MIDCIPADAVRKLRDEVAAYATHLVGKKQDAYRLVRSRLDDLIAQARPHPDTPLSSLLREERETEGWTKPLDVEGAVTEPAGTPEERDAPHPPSAQARPCDEGLREALRRIAADGSVALEDIPDAATATSIVVKALSECRRLARTALAEEEDG